MTTHVVLVRHGESELNVVNCERRVFCGQFETPLTPRGRKQAEQAAAQIAGLDFVHIRRAISSPLARARDTLSILLAHLPGEIQLLPPSPALSERSLGRFQGLSQEEVFQEYPQYRDDPLFNRFLSDWDQRAPGGESLSDVTARVWPAVNQLLSQGEGDLLIVSHIQALRCLLSRALSLHTAEAMRRPIANATPIVLRWNGTFELVEP